jgi:hypothetical protein
MANQLLTVAMIGMIMPRLASMLGERKQKSHQLLMRLMLYRGVDDTAKTACRSDR